MERTALARLWHECAQITRADVFGSDDPLRPEYALAGEIRSQVDIPAVGMVGPNYEKRGVAILSVNPAGGSEKSTSTTDDARLYRLFSAMRTSDSARQLDNFEALNTQFMKCLPSWRIAYQYTTKILQALALSTAEISYLYLVPFRTSGDKGSTMPSRFTEKAFDRHLSTQLHALGPSCIIAMDRPSETYANRWRQDVSPTTQVVYFTRKRDAHEERRKLLARLREHCDKL